MSKIAKVEIPLHVGDTAEFTKTVIFCFQRKVLR